MGGSNFTGGRKQGQFSVFSAEISFVRHGMKEGCAGVGALRGSRNCAPAVNWDNSIRLVRWARWDFREKHLGRGRLVVALVVESLRRGS